MNNVLMIALIGVGYLMVMMIAFFILCVTTGLEGDDPNDDLGLLLGLSFVWPILLVIGIIILPIEVVTKAAEATVKSLEKRRRENDEH